ncbi:Unknown protein sequence [Pseudomonas amygdali pv. dendropanacis]|uniref:Uncharacterized protein n=1 Tax=Pseudomonas amygdali pv. dendropanacis TaxID=235272 RepID=A0A0P9U7I7_PSEA0|nr:Unknown protein sequence [Pseudomonas amygdali pv. dendropanacis]
MTQRLRFAEVFQHARQLIHDGLQGLYQHRTVFDADDVLTGGCAEPHVQPFGLGIPANRDPRASAIGQLGTAQRCRPFIRHSIRHAQQLLGEHALFQGKLFFVGHMLNTAAAAATEILTGRSATHGAGVEDPLGARLDDLAARIEHPRLDLLARQTASDKPGLAVEKSDTATVIGQALDSQPLFLPAGICTVLTPPVG